jgi:CubicO group peptidase (beta-lactamase class C family)
MIPPVLSLAAVAAAATATSPLVGLWGNERVFPPSAEGELTVVRADPEWTASVAGFRVAAAVQGRAIRFELPGGRGEFRGWLGGPSDPIHGHFVQATVLTSGNRFATPVVLRPVASGVWRGRLAPLEDRFSLYLLVTQSPDGSLHAILRNPEINALRGRPLDVDVDGANVRMRSARGDQLTATYDGKSDRLVLLEDLLDTGAPGVGLTRRDRNRAAGFFPRTPEAPGTYRKPQPGPDGWDTASPGEVDLDPGRLGALVQRILDTDPSASPVASVQSVLVARHGKLVIAEYFYGFSEDRLHDLRSASKTFSTTMVGAALAHGTKIDLRSPAVSYFDYPEVTGDPKKREIAVEHLLSMSSGLACDDGADDSPGNENTMQGQSKQPDWYRYTLDLPLLHEPGTYAAYCSATVNLLGGVLRRATGSWLPDLFAEQIAAPLGIDHYAINLAPDGDAYLGGGLRLRPRDFLKLGQLFLDRGSWKGRRVVAEKWVSQATSPRSKLNNGNVDGYNWWIQDLRVGDRTVHTYSAGGNGGQFVVVAPELDLVAAFTGGTYGSFLLAKRFEEELLTRYVFPAAR